MRPAVLAALLLVATPALAQRSPFDEPRPGKVPYDGPQYGGKPPPLGAGPSQGFPDGPLLPVPSPGVPGVGQRPASSGTGFLVAPGRALTNNHVIDDCRTIVARNAQNRRMPVRVVAADGGRDLALLALPEDAGPPLIFRDSPAVRRGEPVVTYGFPLSGLLSSGPTLTTGDVSALSGLRDNPRNYQISAPVQPGNSGGPLLDRQGNVIGVVVSKLNAARIAQMTGGDIPQNVNFAVKGTEALAFLRERGVEPGRAASTGADKRVFEVGEVANPSTLYLQCFR